VTTIKKIETALSRSVCGGWDRGFLESILSHLSQGKTLSLKQKQTLGKVLARTSAQDQERHTDWATIYEGQYEPSARAIAAYHIQQPYYKLMAEDILKGQVPERSKFLRMYDNKYSKKVLTQHQKAARYPVGTYLVPRAAFDSYRHAEFEGDMVWAHQNEIIQNFKKRGGFVLEVCDVIKSAAKGAKRYKLLPIGESTPIIIEERFLKKGLQSH